MTEPRGTDLFAMLVKLYALQEGVNISLEIERRNEHEEIEEQGNKCNDSCFVNNDISVRKYA